MGPHQSPTIQTLAKHYHGLDSLDKATFDSLAPRLVLTPLVADRFDVLEFAQKLQALAFSGRYRAIVRKLPDASMILREVKMVAPSVNFAVTEVLANSKRHSTV